MPLEAWFKENIFKKTLLNSKDQDYTPGMRLNKNFMVKLCFGKKKIPKVECKGGKFLRKQKLWVLLYLFLKVERWD